MERDEVAPVTAKRKPEPAAHKFDKRRKFESLVRRYLLAAVATAVVSHAVRHSVQDEKKAKLAEAEERRQKIEEMNRCERIAERAARA